MRKIGFLFQIVTKFNLKTGQVNPPKARDLKIFIAVKFKSILN
ncbi:hypothetical protein M595_1610 [Lyngbya aestuarii BL J]|uniref:Uncharacterized protein n=1 Tax=Lyngbya aestuarii BL J TaxID=1348334 RepID=U7QK68_9CYAN|nr:hypothetical protein M595_1610 [Lyngbya aestuarii BL J]